MSGVTLNVENTNLPYHRAEHNFDSTLLIIMNCFNVNFTM